MKRIYESLQDILLLILLGALILLVCSYAAILLIAAIKLYNLLW